MKTLALLALLLTACASSDGFVADDVETCEPGSEIELNVGAGDTTLLPDGRVVVMVEVANNSDHPFTVESVRVDPLPQTDQARHEVQGGSRGFDREIPEAEDATFEVPISVRMREPLDRVNQRGVTVGVQVAVTVKLTDGNAARCRFYLPVRF